MIPLLRCIFAHLLILQYPDHHQNLISSSLYYSGPVHKSSSQSVHNFLSNGVHRQANKQTNRQTNQLYHKHKEKKGEIPSPKSPSPPPSLPTLITCFFNLFFIVISHHSNIFLTIASLYYLITRSHQLLTHVYRQ